MASIKGTKTEKNLLASFAGESQAWNRYSFFASAAEKEGFPEIAAIFLETAEHERIHAKNMFKHLEGGDVEITASYPAGVIGTTAENLEASAAGELHEHSQLYPAFADEAQKEGFPQIAVMYRGIARAEVYHEKRFRSLLSCLKDGKLFKRDTPVRWKCTKCGYIHEGKEAPLVCVVCKHPQKYFIALAENQ